MAVTPITVHSWSYPESGATGADAIWSRPSFTPQANRMLTSDANYATSAAAGIGTELATTVNTIKTIKEGYGYEYENYNIFIQNFDSSNPNLSYLRNTLDGITAGGQWVTATPFIANGLIRAKEWGTLFLASFALNLISNGLPTPGRIHFDEERTSMDLTGGTNIPLIFDDLYSSPKAQTETMDGTQTYRQAVDNYRDRNFQPLDTENFDEIGLYRFKNKELIEFVAYAAKRQKDYLLEESLFKRAKQLFPGILSSNWQHAEFDRDFPANGGGKLYTKEYTDSAPYSDFSQIVLYTISNTSYQDANSTVQDWNDEFAGFTSLIPPRDAEHRFVYQASRKNDLDAAVSQRDPNRIMVWHMYPGFAPTLNNWQITNMFEFEGLDSVTNAVSGENIIFFNGGQQVGSGKLAFLEGITNGFRGFVRDYSGGTTADAVALPGGLYAVTSFFESKAFGERWIDGGTNVYEVPLSDIMSFVTHAMSLGVYEHFLWQNPANMTDDRWGQLAQVVQKIEEAAGVLEGEIVSAQISPISGGSRLDIVFADPAQVAWNANTLAEITGKRPELMINGQVQSLSNYESMVSKNTLIVSATTSYVVQNLDECRLTVLRGWFTDTNAPIVSSATLNVRRGENANPDGAVIALANTAAPTPQTTKSIHPRRNQPQYPGTHIGADANLNVYENPFS
jgi:hypothetical protein